MINPAEVTNYNRTQYELEEFILFCINVAGKKSAIEAPKLEVFIERAKNITEESTPFNCIKKLIKLFLKQITEVLSRPTSINDISLVVEKLFL